MRRRLSPPAEWSVKESLYAQWPRLPQPRGQRSVRGRQSSARSSSKGCQVTSEEDRAPASPSPPTSMTQVPAALRGKGGREGGPPFGRGVKLLMCVVDWVVAGQFWPGVRFRSGARLGKRRRGRGRDTCRSAAPQRKCCTNGPGCVLAPRHNKQKPGQEDAAAAHRHRHPWVAGRRGEGPPSGQPPPTPSVKPFSGERVWVLMLLGRARGGDRRDGPWGGGL